MLAHQSGFVANEAITNNSDLFAQLLLLSEKDRQLTKKIASTDSGAIGNDELDNADLLTIGGYPFAIEYFNYKKLAMISVTANSHIPTNQYSLITNNIHTKIDAKLSSNILDNAPTEQISYDKQDLPNSLTQKNNFMSLFGGKKQVDRTLINRKTVEINHVTSHDLINSTKNLTGIGDIMKKAITPQADFSINMDSNDVASPINQALSIANITNEASLLSSASSTITPYTLDLSVPVDAQWQKSLTEHIFMFNRQGLQTAEIKLHPQELGTLHIKLDLADDNLNLHMMAAHNVMKSLLESALPFLRTALQEQGITLQQTNISDFSMMSYADQSAMYHQSNSNQPLNAVEAKATDNNAEQIQPHTAKQVIKSGLSVFA